MSVEVPSESPLRLHPLTFLAEGDEVVIGRADIDSYAVFPPDGAAVVERLASGATPAETADWYEHTYGEPLDVFDFVTTLVELDFLDSAERDAPRPALEPSPRVRWQGLGGAIFGPSAWIGYGAVIAVAIALCLAQPALLPHRDHTFFSRYLLVVEITVAVGQLPLILVHECFHVLAARRLGVPARIRVSHRLYFVVFETVMDGLVLVPRRRRYLPMLAGMLADLIITALLTIAAWAVLTRGGPRVIAGICLALALTTIVRLAMEFLLFLRTDVYYLAATLSGCVDLHTTCREMLHNRLWSVLRRCERIVDPHRWHPRDVRAARWYLPLYMLGYAVALGLLVVVLLPISWRFLDTAIRSAWGHDFGSLRFWDAAGLLLLNGAQPAFAGALALRERAQRLRDRRRRTERVAAAATSH